MSGEKTRTIFVVDDDAVVRDSMTALLQSRQYSVVEFDSGRALLNRDKALAGDCLVVDVHMPEMTGLDLLKTLRDQGDLLPAIVLTGRNDAAITAQARELGAVAVLDKPVRFQALFAAIEKALAS